MEEYKEDQQLPPNEQVVVTKGKSVGLTESLREYLLKETGLTSPDLSKRAEKQRKKEESYWRSMISRKEAFELVSGTAAQQDEKMRMLYVTVNTLLALVKDLGLADQNKLDALAKPFVELMYGPETERDLDEQETSSY